MPNKPLLQATLAHIETLPKMVEPYLWSDGDHWAQDMWREEILDNRGEVCGTAQCFAGWACTLAGSDAHGPTQISVAAQELLGLYDEQAADLFAFDNTIDDLRRIVAELTDPA